MRYPQAKVLYRSGVAALLLLSLLSLSGCALLRHFVIGSRTEESHSPEPATEGTDRPAPPTKNPP